MSELLQEVTTPDYDISEMKQDLQDIRAAERVLGRVGVARLAERARELMSEENEGSESDA